MLTRTLTRTTALTPPFIVRASSLTTYPDCSRRGAAKMFPELIKAMGFELRQAGRSIQAAIGSSVHAAGAGILTEKAASGTLPPVSVALDRAIGALHEEMALGIDIYDKSTAPNASAAEQQTRRMTAVYHRDLAPTIQPIIVEQRLEAQVTPLIVLSGQEDVIAREPDRVRDLKTGKRSNHSPQLGSYCLLGRTHGHPVSGAAVDFIARVALSQPQPAAETRDYDLAAVENAAVHVLRHIEDDLSTFLDGDRKRRIEPGDPWSFPANPNSMLCSDRWCPAHSTPFCVEHARDE